MTDSIEQFIESPHLGCNFIARASLSGSAAIKPFLRWPKPRPTTPWRLAATCRV